MLLWANPRNGIWIHSVFAGLMAVTDRQTDGQTDHALPSVTTGRMEEVPSSMPNFTPIGATCLPCRAKNLKIGL